MSAKKATPSKMEYSKLYYPISEVAKIAGVKAHVLRYWESEFPSLKPRKTRTGSRRYRPNDIDEILAIKELLYDQGFKIAGARKMLRETKKKKPEPVAVSVPQMALKFAGLDDTQKLEFLKNELKEILGLIKELTPQEEPAKPKEMKAKG
ncbi:MAG: DNA-binding transcriptional MerR regulator [Candidatus Krumholzibacteriia bacterium]|jgi:DNA-binding transcriptional MerR regulator